AVIVFGLPPTRLGGTEIATQEISRRLADDHEVHVFTLGLPGEEPYEERYGFKVHRLRTRWVYQLPGVDALYYLSVLRAMKRLNPDIIQIMGMKNRGSYGALIARLLDIPYVIWDRGSINEMSDLHRRTLGYFVLRNADAVIAQTPDMKNKMKDIYPREIRVLGNGIALGLFQGINREAVREKLGLTGKKVVIFLGRMDPVKCVPDIVDAVALLSTRVKNLSFLIVGRGPQRDEIRKYIQYKGIGDITRMTGAVPHERVPEYLCASDVQVLVSRREGFPISIIEGMAAGLSVVASDVGGLTDIVEHGMNGLVVPPHSPERIAESLEILLTDEELREKISCNNLRKAQHYSWDSILETLVGIYHDVLKKSA
ncbi:MAG: glycosyltransferase family 4 protein, partial [Thermoplasmata archaeon]|nr:glycosyltransferase family 4 protein [Thermoplasmata archaeon]